MGNAILSAINEASITMKIIYIKYKYGLFFLLIPVLMEVLSIFIVNYQNTLGTEYKYCQYLLFFIGLIIVGIESIITLRFRHMLLIPIAFIVLFMAYIFRLHCTTLILN